MTLDVGAGDTRIGFSRPEIVRGDQSKPTWFQSSVFICVMVLMNCCFCCVRLSLLSSSYLTGWEGCIQNKLFRLGCTIQSLNVQLTLTKVEISIKRVAPSPLNC